LANTTSCSGAVSVSGACVSISLAACETLDDAVRSAPEGRSALVDAAAEVGVAPASAVAVAVAPASAEGGPTSAGEGAVDPVDGGAEALAVTVEDGETGAGAADVADGSDVSGLFGAGSADVGGADGATDRRVVGGAGGSALVAGALAAVVGATVGGLAGSD
jgi:hypothetical protein